MSIREASVQARHAKIIDATKEPRSINSLANELGFSYHTVRNDINDLMRQELVRATGSTGANGEALFIAGGNRPQPMLHNSYLNKQFSLSEIGINFGNTCKIRTSGEDAARILVTAILELSFQAARAHTTGVLPDQKTLIELRKTLAQCSKILTSSASIADQLLRFSTLWDVNLLPRIADDEAFDCEAIEAAYTKYLTYLEANDVRSTDGAGS